MNLKKQRILVVVAHPDDDLLGCGATLIKAISNPSIAFLLVSCWYKKYRANTTIVIFNRKPSVFLESIV